METTCVRGFSNTFLAEKKDISNLQFVETEELERAWKKARRQRLKKQEDEIWKKFIDEQDVLQTVCQEDPYQFLEQLPEAHIKDLFEDELSNISSAMEQKRGAGDSPHAPPIKQEDNINTSTKEMIENDEVFHIFDRDSDASDTGFNDKEDDIYESPCTVRERDEDDRAEVTSSKLTFNEANEHSSGITIMDNNVTTEGHELTSNQGQKSEQDNMAAVIENSIYCVKVKDLRAKIMGELFQVIKDVETMNMTCTDKFYTSQMYRRASEFSGRFQRIHLYRIQRQMHDIRRQNEQALPFGKYTQFQSQMVRIVNLHQHSLQALQVVRRSFDNTACLTECADAVLTLCAALKESAVLCREVVVPPYFNNVTQLYNDAIVETCDQLENTVKNYSNKVAEYSKMSKKNYPKDELSKADTSECPTQPATKKKVKKKTAAQSPKEKTTQAHLSMYSFETVRLNNKNGGKICFKSGKRSGNVKSKDKALDSNRKSSRSARRPLMRDPQLGLERKNKQPREVIHTAVENITSIDVTPLTSSRRAVSFRNSKPPSPKILSTLPPLQLTLLKRNRNHTPNHQKNATQEVLSPAKDKTSKRDYLQRKKLEGFKAADMDVESVVSQHMVVVDSARGDNNGDSPRAGNNRDSARGGNNGDSTRAGNNRDSARGTNNGDSTREGQCEAIPSGKTDSARSGRTRNEQEGHTTEQRCEVTRILKQLCGGDAAGNRVDRPPSAKNVQLISVNNSSPRQPSTPQLLKILEETIQKKIPKQMYMKSQPRDDKCRLAFNTPQQTTNSLLQYRTKFVQYMLTSSMYANSVIGKPWDMVSSVSEKLIEQVILQCVKDIEMLPLIKKLFESETTVS